MLEIIVLTILCLGIIPLFFYDIITGRLSKNDSPRFRKFKDIIYYLVILNVVISKTIQAYTIYFKH